MYEDEGFAAQRYKITKLNDGYYKIQSINSGKVLDVYAGLKQSGTNVQQYTWNNTDAQKWKILKQRKRILFIYIKMQWTIFRYICRKY